MNWITDSLPPKIRSFLKRDTPENLWVKCPDSGQLVFHKDLEANLFVVPGSGYHMNIKPRDRLKSLLDDGAFTELKLPDVPSDPLKFRDIKRYSDRLKEYRAKTGNPDSIVAVTGKLEGQSVTVAVQDFGFQGGTLGMAAGEAIITAMEHAVQHKTPFVIFTASGGARMQEGMFSLMQMPRTTIAVQRLKVAKLPYIVVLTNPTTGGVTASYAMLGDVHIAEPGAVIGFAGARVIEQTIREKLPEGFQRAEYLQAHGMVDLVVARSDMRATLACLCSILTKTPKAHAPVVETAVVPEPQVAQNMNQQKSANTAESAGVAGQENAAPGDPAGTDKSMAGKTTMPPTIPTPAGKETVATEKAV
jgi:acetyl-CoA carboxylase carboxyl transferase subunit beta